MVFNTAVLRGKCKWCQAIQKLSYDSIKRCIMPLNDVFCFFSCFVSIIMKTIIDIGYETVQKAKL